VSTASAGRRGPAPAAPAEAASRPPAPGSPAPAHDGWAAAAARWLPVAVAAAAMAVLGGWGLARGNAMGNDEVASRYAATLSLGQLSHLLRNTDAVHGLYYLLLHCWIAVGSTATVIRIPSVVVMSAAAGLIVALGRRLTGSAWAGLFAGLIMALDPVISFYAQTARSYAMVFCCVLAATLALVRALEAEDAGLAGAPLARRWLLYGALVTLGGYLNEMALLVLAAHAATVLLTRYGRATVRHWCTAGAAGAFCVLPVILLSIREDAAVSWAAPPRPRAIGILFHDYFGATNLVAVFMLAFAVFAVLPGAGLPAVATCRPRHGRGSGPGQAWWSRGGFSLPSVAAPLLVLPGGLLIAESWVGKPLYADRYVLYAEAGAALLAGSGVCRLGQLAGPWLSRHLTGAGPGGTPGWRSLVWLPGGRSTAPGPRRAASSTTATPPSTSARAPTRATACCSSTRSTGRSGSATRGTSGTSPTSRWPCRRNARARSTGSTSRPARCAR
jgi:mannosyltransferase